MIPLTVKVLDPKKAAEETRRVVVGAMEKDIAFGVKRKWASLPTLRQYLDQVKSLQMEDFSDIMPVLENFYKVEKGEVEHQVDDVENRVQAIR